MLDEEGFWKPLTLVLFVTMPVVKLLRMLDGNTCCMSKVYDRMFMIGQRIESLELKVPWFKELAEIHSDRWEYLHSPMHAAAYALDPQFRDAAGDLDEATTDGLHAIFDRLCLRDAILSSSNQDEAWRITPIQRPRL